MTSPDDSPTEMPPFSIEHDVDVNVTSEISGSSTLPIAVHYRFNEDVEYLIEVLIVVGTKLCNITSLLEILIFDYCNILFVYTMTYSVLLCYK